MALDALLNPALLVGVLNVHVLHTDGAAVRVSQHAQQIAKCGFANAADAASKKLSVEIPNGEPIRCWVQLARHDWFFPAQRVEVGDEVTAHAVHANERCNLHLLVEHCVFAVEQVGILMPLHRFVRNAQAAEHVVIKVVLANQQFVHVLEEHAALGALNDAVVVCAGDGDHF